MKRVRRVLFLSSFWPYPVSGGGRLAGSKVLEAFAMQDLDMDLVALLQDDFVKGSEIYLKTKELRFSNAFFVRWTRDRNLLKLPLYWIKRKSYFAWRDFNKAYLTNLYKLLQENRYDLVVFERDTTYVLVQYVREVIANKKLRSFPYMWHISYNVESDIAKDYVFSSLTSPRKFPLGIVGLVDLLLFRREEKKALALFDWITTISLEDRKYFENNYGVSKLDTMPPAFFSLKKRIKHQCYGFEIRTLASLNWFPNVFGIRWFITKVWPLILRDVPNAVFRVAGRGASKSFINWLKKQPRVVYEGYVEDIDKYLTEACIHMNIVKGGSGIKIKVLQSILRGIPMLVNLEAVKGLPLEMQDVLYASENPVDLANYAVKLLLNQKFAASKTTRYRRLAEKYLDHKQLIRYIHERLNALFDS